MGQLGSKTFQELQDQDEPAEISTPKRCIVLNADPRSPSNGLDRTPITIVAAPSGSAEAENKPSKVLHDPRSPTCGIDRTPIYSSRPEITEGKKSNLIQQALPTRPLFENDYETLANESDSLILEEEQENDENSDQEDQDDVQLLQFHTPLKELPANELVGHGDLSPFVEHSSTNQFVTSSSTETSDVGTELACMSENKLTLDDKVDSQKKVSKIPVSKTRKSPVNTSSKAEIVTQRSPLTPRNVDSETPKALIQRKQIRNIAMQVKNQSCQSQLVSGGFPRSLQLSDDKENM